MPFLLSDSSAEWLRAQKLRAGNLCAHSRKLRSVDGGQSAIPQWRVWIDRSGGEPVVRCDGGRVWLFTSEIEGGEEEGAAPKLVSSADEYAVPAADLGAPHEGAIVWRYSEDGGSVTWRDDGEPEGVYDVTLATIGEDGAIDQLHIDTIFFAVPTDAEDADAEDADAEDADAAPECGHPLNEDDDTNPLDRGNSSGAGAGGSNRDGDDDDFNPLDHEGEGGYTPTCKEP